MSDNPSSSGRSPSWKWYVCGLLLLATMINYMDRLTLSQTAKRVMGALEFKEDRYGELESAFSYAFALGAVLAGWMADRWNVRWLYPAALLVWSSAGFLTGLVDGFYAMLACRFLLGFAEAGHWPCALRTTRHILPPAQRSMGNSILQSGAAVGSILTPLLILGLLRSGLDNWRYPFLFVGAAGMVWVLLWLVSVRTADLSPGNPAASRPPIALLVLLAVLFALKNLVRRAHEAPSLLPEWAPGMLTEVDPLSVSIAVSVIGMAAVYWWLLSVTREDDDLPRPLFLQRLFVLFIVVVVINGTWQFFRAWLPLFLQNARDYNEEFTQWFLLAYYVAADLGSLSAGGAVLLLVRRGYPVHGSRVAVYSLAAALCTLGAAVAVLPRGPALLGLLLVIAFASLALFPNYYSFSQELTTRHQGKVSGALGCMCWLSIAPVQEAVGETVKRTGSYAEGITAAGLAPLLGVVALVFFWGKVNNAADPGKQGHD